jgi:alpha-N-arabinofuranosidase
VHVDLLGVNHRWYRLGEGSWDAGTSAPVPTVVNRARKGGVTSLRYPGGTVATLFDWKQAVGNERGCQFNGRNEGNGFSTAAHARAFGPAEFMRLSNAIGAKALIMVPFIRQSPRDAADWVEYMNSPVGKNPNGGKDWAKVRAAAGHRKPYDIRRWEVGNESQVAPRRYEMSGEPRRSVRQYAFGGVRHIRNEALGKECSHKLAGVPSNGEPDQVFSGVYRPFRVADFSLKVESNAWSRVRNLSESGPNARVYAVKPKRGEVVFGDGRHGAIPRRGATVRATYSSKYQGFFAFARQMKAVDRDIEVCSSYGTPAFDRAVGGRQYDCLTVHPNTNFRKSGQDRWRNALEGHDRMMLGIAHRRQEIARLQRSTPRHTGLWLTEFNAIQGDGDAFPSWSSSMSHAVYMASMWSVLLKRGVPWAMGGDLMTSGEGALLGPAPHYTFGAQARVRQALLPMLRAGGHVVGTNIRRNPTRRPSLAKAGSYGALNVVTTRHGDQLWALVVNQLPGEAVRTQLRINGFDNGRKAHVRRVTSKRFTNWNHPGQPASVRLHTSTIRVDRSGLDMTFPAHSVTVLRFQRR